MNENLPGDSFKESAGRPDRPPGTPCMESVSWCKLYGTYLTVEAELYGAYL